MHAAATECDRPSSSLVKAPLSAVVVLLMLTIAVATASFLIALVVGTAADAFSSAAMHYAETASENAAAAIAQVLKIPEQIVHQNALALASRGANGRRILDPDSIDDAAVWVGPHMNSDIPLYFAFHDNITGNSTILLNTAFTSEERASATTKSNHGPQMDSWLQLTRGSFVASRMGPPNSNDSCTLWITARPPNNPTTIVGNFSTTINYNFRKLPMFDDVMMRTRDDHNIRWYPPSASYGDTGARMVIAQAYTDLDTGAVRGMHLGMLFVTAISTLLLKLQYGQSGLLSGTVALVDADSGAFMGGNFIDNGLRYNSTTSIVVLPNGTISTATRVQTRLGALCEAYSDHVQLACRHLGRDALMGCTTPSSFIHDDHSHWLLRGIESRVVVRVTSITDRYGLNLRLITIYRLDTTLATIAQGLSVALLAVVASIAVLLVVAGLVAHRSLLPLGVLADQLVLVANLHRSEHMSSEDRPPAVSSVASSVYTEIESVLSAFARLKVDLDQLLAFFPPGFSELDSCATAEGLLLRAAQEQQSREEWVGPSEEPCTAPLDLSLSERPASGNIEAQKLAIGNVSMTQVTVLMLNFSGSHALSISSLDAFSQHHSAMLKVIQQAASRSRGVVQAFYGDHFTVAFNASSSVRCRNHVLQCATFMDLLHTEIARLRRDTGGSVAAAPVDAASQPDCRDDCTPVIYAGASTGPALVGHLGGTRPLLYLGVVGPVVTQASCLMRLAKVCRASTLVSDGFVEKLRGVQLSAVGNDTMTNDNAVTMLPRLAVHRVALVRVPFRTTPMVASSLWIVRGPLVHPGDGKHHCCNAETLAERMQEASRAPDGLVQLHSAATCDALLSSHGAPGVGRPHTTTTVAGLRAANDAMLAYLSGDEKRTQELVAACAIRHPPSLVRFFLMTGFAVPSE